MGVTRGSFFILKTGPSASFCERSSSSFCSAFTHMVRNLYMVKNRPSFVTRTCLKIGLWKSCKKTTRAISSIGTLSTATAQNDRITSMARLANKYFFDTFSS